MKIEHIHVISDNQALIRIEGLTCPVTLLHVTDSHMNVTDAQEGLKVLVDSIAAYSFDPLNTINHFERALAYANELSVDGVLLTGDMINGATANNLEYLHSRLQSLNAPNLYTPGNHDWEYPGEPWGESTRQAQYGKFNRLTRGNPACQAVEIGGINVVAVDNSTYQVSPHQLAFVRTELQRGLPTLFLYHIPLYVPSLLKDVLRDWGSPIMMAAEGWEATHMEKWQVGPPSDSTLNFCQLLRENPYGNIIGSFCGHIHCSHKDALGEDCYQYVTQAGFAGGYRMIRLLPLDD
ncbi:metallophosphoesterase [Cohnella ginsengisoli]|uniref:Metallophosphoesterase n=1 Tax=Cohnella ginsengisoli TaxID=425004 RepID=A0A9X4QLA5_9BACL|nr:metallophosphoesterase [Cohnella ginsengisoli]MDG0790534.1 metallophosphoesterase [Cohnella ginsengisoli]